MVTSPLAHADKLAEIARTIEVFLNDQSNIMSPNTISSPRAVGDALQSLLEANFDSLLGSDIKEYSADFARRAMADIAFTDLEDFYHVVDIKTHRLDTAFNMPNLTSVERLSRFYETDSNYFDVLLIPYRVDGRDLRIENVRFAPIEHLSWSSLTIGALGWGQIQIANSNKVTIDNSQLRRDWMLQLCDVLMEFYPAEIGKITTRIEHFKKIRDYWLAKT
jgi:hypothetical protein